MLNALRDGDFVYDSAVASRPCPSGHITMDKREIFNRGGGVYIYEKYARTKERKLKQYGSAWHGLRRRLGFT